VRTGKFKTVCVCIEPARELAASERRPHGPV
jgi:hypothetical protein